MRVDNRYEKENRKSRGVMGHTKHEIALTFYVMPSYGDIQSYLRDAQVQKAFFFTFDAILHTFRTYRIDVNQEENKLIKF